MSKSDGRERIYKYVVVGFGEYLASRGNTCTPVPWDWTTEQRES